MIQLRLTVLQICVVSVANNKSMVYTAQRGLGTRTAAIQEEKQKTLSGSLVLVLISGLTSSREFSTRWKVLGLHKLVLVGGKRAAAPGRDLAEVQGLHR